MSDLSNYTKTKEYIVILKNKEDLEDFYVEMEANGRTFANSQAPERSVACAFKRPASRATHYFLTDWEASDLKLDPRVKSVEIHPRYLGVKPDLFASTKTQTSSNWNKSGSTTNTQLNYGLLRCFEGQDRPNWGSNGTTDVTGTIKLDGTGKNVDVVIVDDDGLVDNHPEYAVNADGTGGSRYIEYNWFQHDPVVKGTPAGNYTYGTGSHSTHVAGTVAGTTQGWARDANIYNIYYYAGAVGDVDFPYVMDYVREFHRTKSVNPETGRKNPTITNNSWGMSIFPSEWSYSDITAVTYRGTRYTPSGESVIEYTGYSGVCDSNNRLAELVVFENGGNRITTSGPYDPPGGDILTKPASWAQEGNQAYLTNFIVPDSQYTLTVQGPGTLTLIHNIAAESFSGNITLSNSIVIKENGVTIQTYSQGPFTSPEGGQVEVDIRETYSLTGSGVYTIEYNTNLDLSNSSNPTVAVALSLTIDDGGSTVPTASVTSIPQNLLGAGSLTSSTVPNAGNNDDGYWTLSLPFNIEYLGNSYNTIFVGTNTYLTFVAGSSAYSGLGPSTPNVPKIMWSCADNSVQRIYYGVEGSAPNRTYRVRIEGTASTGGTIGSPTMVAEYVFYEATPNQIDLQVGVNGRKIVTTGAFTISQLNAWGFFEGKRIPKRVAALDADIEDAIAEGIIYVGAAGNGSWKHDVPGGLDWNNTFEMANRYPDSVANPYYYMRGTSPTANDTTSHPDGEFEIPNICVGSIDVTVGDYKATYSDCGPGVDIFAPGTNVISSYTGGVSDARGGGFLGKLSGTSMASPQVCGVIACALEQNPHWNQYQAKEYITSIAKANQITTTNGGPSDFRDLQGAPNLYLYYRKERADTGITVPKSNQGARPSSGMAWPRPKIYRFGKV